MSKPTILFSADELQPSRVEESFLPQARALSAAGFPSWVLSPQGDRLITKGAATEGQLIVFRGWMMKPIEYAKLEQVCSSASCSLLVDSKAYGAAHHISGWLDSISDLTPETVLLPPDADILKELTALGWPRFFIKDFVKSLKTSRGSIASSPQDGVSLVAEMLKYRDEIEGGLAIRRVELFRPETERRYFILQGVPYSPDPDATVPEIVLEVARRFTLSLFFSVDIVSTLEGIERVVEIGDGQVSDLVGWSPQRFAKIFADHWGSRL